MHTYLVGLVDEQEACLSPQHEHLDAIQPVERSVQQPVVLDEGRSHSLLIFIVSQSMYMGGEERRVWRQQLEADVRGPVQPRTRLVGEGVAGPF